MHKEEEGDYIVLVASEGHQCINFDNSIWGKRIILGTWDDGSDYREETDEWIAEYEKSLDPDLNDI